MSDPVVYVGGPVRWTGGGLVTPAAGSEGVCRGAKLGCVFVNGGNANETRDAVLFFFRHCAPVAGALKEYGKGSTKKYVVYVRILCY